MRGESSHPLPCASAALPSSPSAQQSRWNAFATAFRHRSENTEHEGMMVLTGALHFSAKSAPATSTHWNRRPGNVACASSSILLATLGPEAQPQSQQLSQSLS